MKIKDEAQIEKRRQEILKCAEELIVAQGIEALSIRKIADAIHQTPGIIYHYFKNKDELLMEIVKDRYQHIVFLVRECFLSDNPIEVRLSQTIHAYIEEMIKEPDLYKIFMQSKHPEVLAQTQVLKAGISKERSSIAMLCQGIEQGIAEGVFSCEHVELRAQTIWCAMYGCLGRCIEEGIQEKQRTCIIDELVNMILASLRR